MHCTWMFLLGSVLLPCFLAYERGYCTINLEEPAMQAFDKIQIKKGNSRHRHSCRGIWPLLAKYLWFFWCGLYRLSLFAFSPLERLLSSELVACSSSAKVQPGTVMLVSSANIIAQDIKRQLGRSFIYIKKSRGPSILPWGTP